MTDEFYHHKYIKYKTKYLTLREELAGGANDILLHPPALPTAAELDRALDFESLTDFPPLPKLPLPKLPLGKAPLDKIPLTGFTAGPEVIPQSSQPTHSPLTRSKPFRIVKEEAPTQPISAYLKGPLMELYKGLINFKFTLNCCQEDVDHIVEISKSKSDVNLMKYTEAMKYYHAKIKNTTDFYMDQYFGKIDRDGYHNGLTFQNVDLYIKMKYSVLLQMISYSIKTNTKNFVADIERDNLPNYQLKYNYRENIKFNPNEMSCKHAEPNVDCMFAILAQKGPRILMPLTELRKNIAKNDGSTVALDDSIEKFKSALDTVNEQKRTLDGNNIQIVADITRKRNKAKLQTGLRNPEQYVAPIMDQLKELKSVASTIDSDTARDIEKINKMLILVSSDLKFD